MFDVVDGIDDEDVDGIDDEDVDGTDDADVFDEDEDVLLLFKFIDDLSDVDLF